MEVDLGPSQLPLKGPRVGRLWKVREEAGNTKRAFSGFEAEPGQTPHQSLFGRLRHSPTKPFTRTWRREEDPRRGGPAVEATRPRPRRSIAPWRFRDGPHGAFPWHGETVSGREAP